MKIRNTFFILSMISAFLSAPVDVYAKTVTAEVWIVDSYDTNNLYMYTFKNIDSSTKIVKLKQKIEEAFGIPKAELSLVPKDSAMALQIQLRFNSVTTDWAFPSNENDSLEVLLQGSNTTLTILLSTNIFHSADDLEVMPPLSRACNYWYSFVIAKNKIVTNQGINKLSPAEMPAKIMGTATRYVPEIARVLNGISDTAIASFSETDKFRCNFLRRIVKHFYLNGRSKGIPAPQAASAATPQPSTAAATSAAHSNTAASIKASSDSKDQKTGGDKKH